MTLSSLSAAVGRLSLSLRAQLALFTIISLAVPVLLYFAFGMADREKRMVLLDAVRGEDVVIAKALAPELAHLAPADLLSNPGFLERFTTGGTSLKLLYQQNGVGQEGSFFYVASAPSVTPAEAAAERKSLADLGILDRVGMSCAGNLALSERVVLSEGKREVLTSVAPVKTDAGCWVLVVAAESRSLLGEISGRLYWDRPTVRIALITYAAMTLLALAVFGNVWRTLARFRRVARDLDAGSSFAGTTQIPELAPMAVELDRMVARLGETAALLRRSAEDNAHAFKTPLAIIRQSVDMLRRPVGPDRSIAALDAIGVSLGKLDGLVRSARRLDVATADLLDTAHHRVDLSALVEGFAAEHRLMLADRAGRLIVSTIAGVTIAGREELVETILENLVDNALSFSAPDGHVFVTLTARDGCAALTVADDGPGVHEDALEGIFERYRSNRPPPGPDEPPAEDAHYGVGLWLVRQNTGALGGKVVAANRPQGGLVVTVSLPLVRSGAVTLAR